MSCTQCQGIELQFDLDAAQHDVDRYRKKGLPKTTSWLVDYFTDKEITGYSMLDIGGGIGMIQHKLLEAGVIRSTHVDASSSYLEKAKGEAERLGFTDRINFQHGDFVNLSPELEKFEIVTLDKVICCFDDMEALVKTSSAKAKKYYAVIFPQSTWWNKAAFAVITFFMRFRRNPFRIFIHASEEIEKIVTQNGLKRVYLKRGMFWQLIVYSRL